MCATSGAPAPARAAATCSLVSIHGAPCFVRVCRCAATVVELGHGEVKVSYVGWGQEWDEWRKMRLDEIQRNQPARELPCHHTFHRDCIGPWLQVRNSCPECRAPVV